MGKAERGKRIGRPRLSASALSAMDEPSTPAPESPHLSDRERECLGLVAAGLSNKQIALRLDLSPRTVEQHVINAIQHLGASNRTHAVAVAIRASLL